MITAIDKIKHAAEAEKIVKDWQNAGMEVVFTNGCFDLIHIGHLKYLEEAKSLGQKLVIGLNSDASVSRLKGVSRPIKDVKNRSYLLACLQMVDLVVVFEEDTPLKLIEAIQPDILVKGGDWSVDQIVGSDYVLKKGGKVLSLQFLEGYSSTNLIEKILKKD